MTTDPIAAAIDHIRSITPADGPWTPAEFATPGHDTTPTDRAIATILNAVAEGQLINRASRDEMLAQVRRGEGFATAGAEASWISDSEAGVYDTDAPDPIAAARALIEPLTGYTPGMWEPFFGEAYRVRSDGMTIATAHFVTLLDRIPTKQVAANTALIAAAPDLRDMVATLAEALEAERAKVAAAFAMQDAGYSITTPSDAKAALDKMLAEARLEGWRAGREAAAEHCWTKRDLLADAEQKQVAAGLTGRDYYGRRLEAELLSRSIRALPEGG